MGNSTGAVNRKYKYTIPSNIVYRTSDLLNIHVPLDVSHSSQYSEGDIGEFNVDNTISISE